MREIRVAGTLLLAGMLLAGCERQSGSEQAAEAVAPVAAPAAGLADTASADELRQLAGAAMQAQRLFAPARGNALEYYLAASQRGRLGSRSNRRSPRDAIRKRSACWACCSKSMPARLRCSGCAKAWPAPRRPRAILNWRWTPKARPGPCRPKSSCAGRRRTARRSWLRRATRPRLRNRSPRRHLLHPRQRSRARSRLRRWRLPLRRLQPSPAKPSLDNRNRHARRRPARPCVAQPAPRRGCCARPRRAIRRLPCARANPARCRWPSPSMVMATSKRRGWLPRTCPTRSSAPRWPQSRAGNSKPGAPSMPPRPRCASTRRRPDRNPRRS